MCVCFSLALLRRAVHKTLGAEVACFTALVTSCQFHFLFYASRPLPNTFALILGTYDMPPPLSKQYLIPFKNHVPFQFSSSPLFQILVATTTQLLHLDGRSSCHPLPIRTRPLAGTDPPLGVVGEEG